MGSSSKWSRIFAIYSIAPQAIFKVLKMFFWLTRNRLFGSYWVCWRSVHRSQLRWQQFSISLYHLHWNNWEVFFVQVAITDALSKDLLTLPYPWWAYCKNIFISWTPAVEEALDSLKCVVTTSPMLWLPDFSQQFITETNALGDGVGMFLVSKVIP